MKIVYIHQYFRFAEEGGAIRSWYIAKALADAGHDVTVISSRNIPEKKIVAEDGFRVIFLPIAYENKFGYYRRFWAFLRFAFAASKEIGTSGPHDICYATSTPLTVGITVLRAKRKYQLPYHFEVRDLWPEVPYQLGILRNPLLVLIARILEKRIYKNAKSLIGLSPAIVDALQKTSPGTPVHFAPNMSDVEYYGIPSKKLQKDRSKLKLVYTGNLGLSSGIEYLIELAKLADKQNEIWLDIDIAGTGLYQNLLTDSINKYSLKNLRYHGFLNRAETKSLLQEADMALIVFKQEEALWMNSPNKFFDALACGLPIITNMGGWIKGLVEKNNCGLSLDFSDLHSVFQNLNKLHQNRPHLSKMAKNSQKIAVEHFDKDILAHKLTTWICQ